MDLTLWRQRLMQEKEDLRAGSEDSKESRGAVALDQQSIGRLSRMDALQQQAMSVAAERRRQIRMRRIDAALKRIDKDEFGYCVICGEEIPEARLLVDPTSPSCVQCAAAERERK